MPSAPSAVSGSPRPSRSAVRVQDDDGQSGRRRGAARSRATRRGRRRAAPGRRGRGRAPAGAWRRARAAGSCGSLPAAAPSGRAARSDRSWAARKAATAVREAGRSARASSSWTTALSGDGVLGRRDVGDVDEPGAQLQVGQVGGAPDADPAPEQLDAAADGQREGDLGDAGVGRDHGDLAGGRGEGDVLDERLVGAGDADVVDDDGAQVRSVTGGRFRLQSRYEYASNTVVYSIRATYPVHHDHHGRAPDQRPTPGHARARPRGGERGLRRARLPRRDRRGHLRARRLHPRRLLLELLLEGRPRHRALDGATPRTSSSASAAASKREHASAEEVLRDVFAALADDSRSKERWLVLTTEFTLHAIRDADRPPCLGRPAAPRPGRARDGGRRGGRAPGADACRSPPSSSCSWRSRSRRGR